MQTGGGMPAASIVPLMRYRDCAAAIDWLGRAFGFEQIEITFLCFDRPVAIDLNFFVGEIFLVHPVVIIFSDKEIYIVGKRIEAAVGSGRKYFIFHKYDRNDFESIHKRFVRAVLTVPARIDIIVEIEFGIWQKTVRLFKNLGV